MIEEFMQDLRRAEADADVVVKVARDRVQTIRRDSDLSITAIRASSELLLQQQLDTIDQETNQQMQLAGDWLREDLKQQLENLERQAQDHRPVALDLLVSGLTAR
jgi:vacuolar-type H+-ATPase subunit H